MYSIVNPVNGLMVFCTDCGLSRTGSLSIFINGSWNIFSTSNCDIAQPSAGSIVPSKTQIVWNWTTAAGATGYKWNTTNDFGSAADMGANTSKTETGLTTGTSYTRYVWAYNYCGSSPVTILTQSTLVWACGEQIIDSRDGKSYNSVQIGTQCWMKENLNVGARLNVTGVSTNNGVIEKFCYDDNEANCSVYGGLYAWNEMMNYVASSNLIPSGVQGICMTGWHIPSDAEWGILTTYVDSSVDPDYMGWTGSIAGDNLKEAGLTYWLSPSTGNNSSGFTGLPAGGHDGNVFVYETLGMWGDTWTSTEYDSSTSRFWHLHWSHSNIYHWMWIKVRGISVRCVKN